MGTFRSILVVPLLLTLAACGSPTAPPPVPDAPTLSCPASTSIESPDNVSMPVTFTVPTASGGQSPVTVTCTAPSGASFPLGSTIVTCTATDALARQASCNFNVTVAATPRISKTKFLAFGVSITFGRCDAGGVTCPPYTTRLDELLRERYTRQTFTVTNIGIPGEVASDDIVTPGGEEAGQDRLRRVLPVHNPEVLLLMEGTNDLFHERVNGPDLAIAALDVMVTRARDMGISVFLATIAPQRLGGPRDAVARIIPAFNEEHNLRAGVLDGIYDYLKENLSVRYVYENMPVPEMELKFAKDELDNYQLKTRVKIPLTGLDVWFSSINMNIAFKEDYLKSDKDLEDARHLRIVFAEDINEDEIKKIKRMIRKLKL